MKLLHVNQAAHYFTDAIVLHSWLQLCVISYKAIDPIRLNVRPAKTPQYMAFKRWDFTLMLVINLIK